MPMVTTYNKPFLTTEDVQRISPSALAASHDGRRSDRYSFVPTIDIINSMEANGWGIVEAKGPKTRTELSRGFGLHQLTFQEHNATAIADPRAPSEKPIFPRIHIINSHNGTTKFEIFAGLYALVCSNGLVISKSTVGEFSVRHNNGFSKDDAFEAISQFRNRLSDVASTIDGWRATNLQSEQANAFAAQAARIRWNKPSDVIPEPEILLSPRRTEDAGSDLWSRFNVVQENLIGGGFKRSRREARPLSHIKESNRVNSELWDLAKEYYQVN